MAAASMATWHGGNSSMARQHTLAWRKAAKISKRQRNRHGIWLRNNDIILAKIVSRGAVSINARPVKPAQNNDSAK